MRTYRLGDVRGPATLIAVLLLVACGGGGGESPPSLTPVVYTGSTSPAAITAANASQLTADVIGSDDTASTIVGASIETGAAKQDRTNGAMELALRLNRSLRDAVLRVNDARRVAPALQVDQTEPCDNGVGSVRTTGTLNDVSFTGTLTVSFNSCLIDGDTLNGPATLRVDEFSFHFAPGIPSDSTLSFTRLTIRGPGVSVDATGSMRLKLDVGMNSETVTANLDSLNNSTNLTSRVENLVFANVYNSIFTPTSFAASISGKVFDHAHGYVAITTVAPLAFGTLGQLFPDSGQLVLTGAGNRSIRATSLSATLARLEVDLDGNSAYEIDEIDARLKWTDLLGPVGADLADTDGDGMHNSWETVNHLNPALADGSLDADGDGFTNLAEYRGGGTPDNAASIPAMLVSSAIPVASDVAAANSDTEMPGKSGVAFDGTNYLLVSCRDVAPNAGLFGVRMSASGQVLGNFPIPGATCSQRPAVAFDGTNFLVLFTQGGQIVGTRVTPAGTVLDGPSGFAVSTSGTSNFHAAVAFDGTNYLVVWNKFVNNTQYEIYGARVTPDGSALGEFPIFAAPGEQVFPALAFDGTNYLVIWRDTRSGSGPSTDTDLYGTRVTPAGTILDPLGIAIATAPGVQEPGGIAFDGTNYLVVWNHTPLTNTSPPPDGKIYGRRVTPAGVLLDGTASSDGIAISTGPFANHSSSVAFAGSNYIVTWAVSSFPNFPPAGIFATRVTKSGSRIDGLPSELGRPISGAPPSFSRYVHPVATSGGQDALISWANNIEMSGAQKDIVGVLVTGF